MRKGDTLKTIDGKKLHGRYNTNKADQPLTIKEQMFLNERLENPTESATKSAIKAGYSAKTAHVIASENLRKPKIISKLGNYNKLVESTISSVLRDYKKSEKLGERQLAVSTAMWMHDKIHGKATQTTTSVNAHFYGHIDNKKQTYGL